MPHENIHEGQRAGRSENTNAYLVGGGIASLAAAVHLIHDVGVPANRIHIIESGSLLGGSMDGAGDSENGYVLRGGRMLNFSYCSCAHMICFRCSLLSQTPQNRLRMKSIGSMQFLETKPTRMQNLLAKEKVDRKSSMLKAWV